MAYFAPYIDGTGLHLPTYQERLDELAELVKQSIEALRDFTREKK